MKQTILKTTIILLMFCVAPFAFALTYQGNIGAKAEVKADARVNIQNIRENAQAKIKEIRTEVKASTTEMRVDNINRLIDNRFDKMNQRFGATIDRLENIMTRVNTRITKIKGLGGNTTTAEKFVADASVSLETAKTALVTMTSTGATTVTLESATSTKAQAKASLLSLIKTSQDLQKNLKDAQMSLEKAVGSLKGLSQAHATSTEEVKANAGVNNQN